MNVEQIMKLVDEYAWRAHPSSDNVRTEKARNEVVAAVFLLFAIISAWIDL